MGESVFETFIVEDKIEELKTLLGKGDFSDLNEKKVAVAIPVYDESMRNIQLFDKDLYITQKNDLEKLRDFLLANTEISLVHPITHHCAISSVRGIDYLILLHEFTQSEEDNIIEELQANNGKEFKVYSLY